MTTKINRIKSTLRVIEKQLCVTYTTARKTKGEDIQEGEQKEEIGFHGDVFL